MKTKINQSKEDYIIKGISDNLEQLNKEYRKLQELRYEVSSTINNILSISNDQSNLKCRLVYEDDEQYELLKELLSLQEENIRNAQSTIYQKITDILSQTSQAGYNDNAKYLRCKLPKIEVKN